MKKIATPVTNGNMINGHFGHADSFKIYSITETNEIVSTEIVDSSSGCGCKSGIAAELKEKGVSVMLVGGIGNGAINVLDRNGISVVKGVEGNSEIAVKDYLDGKLVDNGEVCASHEHHHGNGHHHH